MCHDWKRLESIDLSNYGNLIPDQKKSDVHICTKCNQICLSEIGEEADESIMADYIKYCPECPICETMNS